MVHRHGHAGPTGNQDGAGEGAEVVIPDFDGPQEE